MVEIDKNLNGEDLNSLEKKEEKKTWLEDFDKKDETKK